MATSDIIAMPVRRRLAVLTSLLSPPPLAASRRASEAEGSAGGQPDVRASAAAALAGAAGQTIALPSGGETLTVRAARPADLRTLDSVSAYGFAADLDAAAHLRVPIPEGGGRLGEDATFGAFTSSGSAVSQLLAHPWTLGGGMAGLKTAAVSGVGTLPEYRRLGLLRAQMRMLFEDMREKGQAVATLAATQAAIYQRYGYVQAVHSVMSYCIDSVDIRFVDGDGGSCTVRRQLPSQELVDEALRPLYEGFIDGRACAFGYDTAGSSTSAHRQFMPHVGADGNPRPFRGNSQYPHRIQHCAVARDASGKPRGYVLYRTVGGEPDVTQSVENFRTHGSPIHRTRFQKLYVFELIWADLDAYRSLWSFLARHDLVGELHWAGVPADDPAAHIFLEPRLLHTQVSEGSWWRIVDVGRALAGREYAFGRDPTEAEHLTLTLAIEDDERLAPWNSGMWKLSVGADGRASVSPVAPAGAAATAEVSIGIAALTNLWTGAVSAKQLSAWGMLEARDSAALARCDLLFAMEKTPFCCEGY
eukprot:SAG31_NODE_4697_length_3026_cov_1.822685_1_plen_532_part_00